MNMKKKPLGIVGRARKSFVGRIVCRVMGEESGQAMMEYVIIAVLIAAAVAVGAWFFGKDLMNMFGTAGRAATGDDDGGRQMQKDAADGNRDGHKQADATNKDWIKTQGEDNATIE